MKSAGASVFQSTCPSLALRRSRSWSVLRRRRSSPIIQSSMDADASAVRPPRAGVRPPFGARSAKDDRVDRGQAEELLRTLFADPDAARRKALAELVPDPDPALASIGHQIVGIVLRDSGRTDEALAHLRRALALAQRVDGERAADVRATLGGSLVYAGRTREGLAQLDRAAAELDGLPLARVLVRRARVLSFTLEDFEAGADDVARALEILEGSDDDVWRARALHLEGLTRTGLGDLHAARRAFAESMRDPHVPGPAGRPGCRGPHGGVARLPRRRPAPRARGLRGRERPLRRSRHDQRGPRLRQVQRLPRRRHAGRCAGGGGACPRRTSAHRRRAGRPAAGTRGSGRGCR